MSERRQAEALAKVRKYRAELTKATKAHAAAQRRLTEWITKAVDSGVTGAEVARVAGVSRGRVSQIAPVAKAALAPVHAEKKGDEPVRVNDPATVPSLPATPAGMLSGIVSTRQRRPYGRTTMFYDVRDGSAELPRCAVVPVHLGGMEPGSIAHILYTATEVAPRASGGEVPGRVFLVGPPPLDPDAGVSQLEQVRAWALTPPGDGWTAGAHYLGDATLPVLRFTGPRGEKVTILRAAAWWGETDASVRTCADAWAGLGVALDKVPAFAGAGIADTPATTGRALWLRTIPENRNYPVLSDELRELIGATSGQGRIELRPEPYRLPVCKGVDLVQNCQDFTYLDGRFMYAALTWGMPVGEPRRWTGEQLEAASARDFTTAMRGRGRWRITCQVPDGWQHVGMFMAPDGAGGWCYPSEPGQVFTTWADGSEVWAGLEQGWEPVFHEGLTWAEGKPLDTWRDALVGVWEAANAHNSAPSQLGARAVRSILLYALGAFATKAHPVTHSAPVDGPAPEVPAGTEVRRVGENLVWHELAKQSAWTQQTAHPEWSATVWARARTRLLTGRGVGQERVGALHLPVESVVAFATDALYVAGGSPGWADDGRPGRFRSKGTRPGAFLWPANRNELYALRDEAERRGE